MWRSPPITYIVRRLNHLKKTSAHLMGRALCYDNKAGETPKRHIGENVSKKDKVNYVVTTVIKWMLSKGQGTTMGTYGQLIRALDMDHRVEEAHEFWERKIGLDLHSVPWQLCNLMISVYYRNNMLEDLVRLFKGLEAFNRKPRNKAMIQKVANAYEMLGSLQEKERVLEKYSYLFDEEGRTMKSGKGSYKDRKKESLSAKKERRNEFRDYSFEEEMVLYQSCLNDDVEVYC